MAWERRGQKQYFYTSQKHGRHVRKVYFGSGALGRIAETAVIKRRQRRARFAAAEQAELSRFTDAQAQGELMREWCDLLIQAVLLASGFRRPQRHSWRRWRYGEKVLAEVSVPGTAGSEAEIQGRRTGAAG
jgi:hypothetical protein